METRDLRPPSGDHGGRQGRVHILYVEDDPTLVEMYGYILGRAGHRFSSAADGESGLQAALELDPDLVLLDMRLPRMQGLTVLEQLRRRLYGGEVWITSNEDEAELRRQAESNGATRWLVKSQTSPSHLRKLVEDWSGSALLQFRSANNLRDLRGRSIDEIEENLLVTDDSGAYVAASDRALDILGYERAELLGRHIWDIAPDWEISLAQESFEAFKGDGAQRGRFVLRTKSGALLTIKYEAYASIRRGLHMSIFMPEPS